jgi:hypothetical protein
MLNAGNSFEHLVAEYCKTQWAHEYISVNRSFNGRELDILINSDQEIILIECTTERGKRKAEHDISKIRDLRRVVTGDADIKPVRGYFITQHDPSPEVHDVAAENGTWIRACSFPAFVNEHNSSTLYIFERKKRAFGSVRNPVDDSTKVERNQYVQIPFRMTGSNQEFTLDRIIDDLIERRRTRLILTGDFGIGKSMTFREISYRLADKYENGEIYRFPIYINLRDAIAADYENASDIIDRHAIWLGLRNYRDKLVHAWATDCCILLLDGFDEVIRSGFTALTISARDIRYASSHIIRELVRHSEPTTPIMICGRQSYFPNIAEMDDCLGTKNFSHASLHDLSEREVRELYRKFFPRAKNPIIFDWLPQRPLLLAYLYFALDNQLKQSDEVFSVLSPGEGWDRLLARLCERETEVAKGAEPPQIRRLLERVALYARTNIAAVGNVTSLQFAQAYRDVFKAEPGLGVQQVLMRLPGLTPGGADEDRHFIDNTIFEAAQAGTVVEITEALSTRSQAVLNSEEYRSLFGLFRRTHSVISDLTAQVTITRLKQKNRLGILPVALAYASTAYDINVGNLVGDLLQCCFRDPEILLRHEDKLLNIIGAQFSRLELTDEILSRQKLKFADCIIEELDLSFQGAYLANILFSKTTVGRIFGSDELSPHYREIGLGGIGEEIISIDATDSEILSSELPPPIRALKIILKRLFWGPATGRKKNIFFHGIRDLNPIIIEHCLGVLLRHRIVYVQGQPTADDSVWYPNRIHGRRVGLIVDAPAPISDIVVSESVALT